jgi:endonuclease YncB( thermonuclease family)
MEEQTHIWISLMIVAAIVFIACAFLFLPRKKRKASIPPPRTEQGTAYQKAKVLTVIDGDTVIVLSLRRTIRVRLDAIDCPEAGQPWGDTAKYGLIKLIGGREVLLEEHCVDQHGRTVATLYVEDRKTSRLINVNERMVTLGHAWVMRKYYDHLSNNRKAQLNRLERWARSKSVGLWRTSNPIRPSKWRHDSGSDLI